MIFKICGVTNWITSNYNAHIVILHMSRSKRNQAIKFGQLIEYSIKIIFLKKSCTKYGGETGPRSFKKKQNKFEHISEPTV